MNTQASEVLPSSEIIETRIEPIKHLKRIADYFLPMEPNRPMSYLASGRSAIWTNALEEWLRKAVKNEGVQHAVRALRARL